MKVLFVLIDMNIGGTEKALLNLLYFLPENYQVTLLLLKKQGGFLTQIPSKVTVLEIKNPEIINKFIQDPPLKSIRFFFKQQQLKLSIKGLFNYILSKITKNHLINFKTIDFYLPKIDTNFDIAVAFAGPHEFISYYVINNVTALKKIQWIHFDVSKIYFNTSTALKLYAKFDAIKTVSTDVKNEFLNFLPQLKNKIELQSNVVSSEIILKMANEKFTFFDTFQEIKIVTVGRLTKEKGHDMFAFALRKLINDGYNLKWIIVGNGDRLSKLQQQINDLQLTKNVIFAGSTTNPYGYIMNTDIYVQPSYYEGHCVTLLEAKILNRPILATNFAGASDEIVNEKNGIIVPISSEGLYQGMKNLLDNKVLRTLLMENLRIENASKTNQEIEL